MKIPHLLAAILAIGFAAFCALGQGTVVVHDPALAVTPAKLSAGEQSILDKSVLPLVRSKLAGDACEETIEVAGIVQGAFTRPDARQTLIFYQFCQTGNGLGSAGVAVIEDGALAANYVAADAGWTVDAKV